jgi:hypothetical protein
VALSPSSVQRIQRLITLGLALLLTQVFLVDQARAWWTEHWILKDGQQGMGVVTEVLWTGHNHVAYRYSVNQKEYTGADFRSWQNPKYANVMISEHTVIYYSSSHPWLSRINHPRSDVPEGLPVLILIWLVIARLFIAAINPNAKSAFGPFIRSSPSTGKS